jgi:glycine/D-amino acid oxidase-like deaminating enzyme
MPGIAELNAIRTWTGFRPATPDSLPILDRHPSNAHLWLAVGHEGLGVTTATGTADIMVSLMTGGATPLDVAPFALGRFDGTALQAHAAEANTRVHVPAYAAAAAHHATSQGCGDVP